MNFRVVQCSRERLEGQQTALGRRIRSLVTRARRLRDSQVAGGRSPDSRGVDAGDCTWTNMPIARCLRTVRQVCVLQLMHCAPGHKCHTEEHKHCEHYRECDLATRSGNHLVEFHHVQSMSGLSVTSVTTDAANGSKVSRPVL